MLLLTSASDLLQMITTNALNTDTHASFVDLASGSVTPGRENHQRTTAATLTLVASPAGSTYRNIKTVAIYNRDTTTVQTITVQHYDGSTTAVLMKCGLLPGESLHYSETAGWFRMTATGLIVASGAAQATVDRQTFTASGTWTKPTGFTPTKVFVQIWGPGGGGGAGGSLATNVVAKGGAGGGGGSYSQRWYDAADLSGTEAVTIGLGGQAGTPGVAGAAGGAGGQGGNSAFKTMTAYAGGGGTGGGITALASTGGGGASSLNAAVSTTGGIPTAATLGFAGQGVTGNATATTQSAQAELGGAGGGGSTNVSGAAAASGGSSIMGGGGGGMGGSHTNTNTVVAPADGGASGSYTAGGGGAVGTSQNSPVGGGTGANATSLKGGAGGGGGGSTAQASTNGATGGDGGVGGGGGGGGGVGENPGLGGAGGTGGTGYCIITTW
jgi:hypothetical protein